MNIINFSLVEIKNPLSLSGGFKYTENFDGIWKNSYGTFYLNLKMICDYGGAQTRSMRELYHFLNTQKEYLETKKTKTFFL